MDRRPFERRGVQIGRVDLAQAAVAFKPHIARPVDHDFAHVRVLERRLQPWQKRFQQVQPVAAGHSSPASLAAQYGRSRGR